MNLKTRVLSKRKIILNNVHYIFKKKPYNSISRELCGLCYMDFFLNQDSIANYKRKILKLSCLNDNENLSFIQKIYSDVFDECFDKQKSKIKITSLLDEKERKILFLDYFIIDLVNYFLKYEKINIPLSNFFLEKHDPIKIYEAINKIASFFRKDAFVITNDLCWAGVFNDKIGVNFNKEEKSIPQFDFYWVESDLDVFTYSLFFPNKKFKRAGSSGNIFKILEKNPLSKAIIDKDGFSEKNFSFLKDKYNLYFTVYSECENIWFNEKVIDVMNLFSPEKINIDNFKSCFLNRAFKNLNTIMRRMKNRQDYLMYHYIPYLNDYELANLKDVWLKNIVDSDYESILSWQDNKKIFENYIRDLGYKSENEWKKSVMKNKHLFKNISFEIIR